MLNRVPVVVMPSEINYLQFSSVLWSRSIYRFPLCNFSFSHLHPPPGSYSHRLILKSEIKLLRFVAVATLILIERMPHNDVGMFNHVESTLPVPV